jgi:sugar/nucleoside kinase (ribokinase family)
MEKIDFVTFALIIDDIVFPDGRTAMGVLGGGGPQTAFGMRLWTDRVGLVSGVGQDLPAEARAWLEASGIDLAGLRHSDRWPTPRAWQVMEADGQRTQVWRIPGPAIGAQLGRSLDKLPPAYRQARAFHIGVHPEGADQVFIAALRGLGAIVSIEPFRPAERPLSDDEIRALVSAGQIFSPNLQEAQSIVGSGEPLELIRRLAQAGAEIVALRQGADGATVYRADRGETWYIPAIETAVVDPVGAGNTFCGAFLAGWVQSGDARLAGLYGVIAASFLVEQVGLPGVSGEAKRQRSEETKRRLEILESRVVKLS